MSEPPIVGRCTFTTPREFGACALRNSLTVLHHDRDFDALARIAPLEARRI